MITVLPVGINKVFRVPKEEWNMYCISVSFKKTPVSIRQQFAFSAEEQKRFLSGLQAAGRITGGVVLSTCNRSEIYVSGGKDALEAVEDALASWKAVEKEQIKTYCLYYGGKRHISCLLETDLQMGRSTLFFSRRCTVQSRPDRRQDYQLLRYQSGH